MLRDRRPRGDHGRQVIGESAGKVEGLRFRRAVVLVEQGGRTGPADLDAPEQIRLGSRHPVEPRRLEAGILAEDPRIGVEAHRGAAAVLTQTGLLPLAGRRAPAVLLKEALAVERYLHLQLNGTIAYPTDQH